MRSGVSDRQWRDVVAIVRVQGARIGVADLLTRVLEEGGFTP
jgi:hypothetical protein